MSNTKTVHVPHLGGIDAAYQMPKAYDSSKPTLVLVNSFTTSSELYKAQYENKALNDAMNLISIELLGHGQTRTKSKNFTYWDTAIMNLQVMEALGIKKAFVLGTSQGGWITVRMALLAPDKVSLLMFPIITTFAQILFYCRLLELSLSALLSIMKMTALVGLDAGMALDCLKIQSTSGLVLKKHQLLNQAQIIATF